MSFEQQIQQWVSIDNQLKTLNEKVKELREKKNQLSEDIIVYADDNNLSSATIKISDGKLKFANNKITQPLTLKYLETCLGEIIKNPEQVEKIMDYIKAKREIKYEKEIKRFSEN
jgi:hypothetical protein